MRSNTFKRRLGFSFTVLILGLKQLSTTVNLKGFITKALEYKTYLKY